MKKLFLHISPLLLFMFCFINTNQATAQGQMRMSYKCHNFYGNGVTEYLDRVFLPGGGEKDIFYYYSSTNRKKIKLIVVSFKQEKIGGRFYMVHTVHFPGDTKKYRLSSNFNDKTIYCDNPNGKQQSFKEFH